MRDGAQKEASSRRRVLWQGGLILAGLLGAGRAQALAIDPSPVPLSGDATGAIALVSVETGLPAGAVQLGGSTGAGDITLVFELGVSSGAVEELSVAALTLPFSGVTATGSGWIPGGGVDIAQVGGTATTISFDFGVAGTPEPGEGVGAGEASDHFFVSYAALAEDGSQGLNFAVDPATGPDFTVQALLVPEPGALALVAGGLMAGAILTRLHRRR